MSSRFKFRSSDAVQAWQRFYEAVACLEGWPNRTPPPITPKEAANLKRLTKSLTTMAGAEADQIDDALLPFLRAVWLVRKKGKGWWASKGVTPTWLYAHMGEILAEVQSLLAESEREKTNIQKILKF